MAKYLQKENEEEPSQLLQYISQQISAIPESAFTITKPGKKQLPN